MTAKPKLPDIGEKLGADFFKSAAPAEKITDPLSTHGQVVYVEGKPDNLAQVVGIFEPEKIDGVTYANGIRLNAFMSEPPFAAKGDRGKRVFMQKDGSLLGYMVGAYRDQFMIAPAFRV